MNSKYLAAKREFEAFKTFCGRLSGETFHIPHGKVRVSDMSDGELCSAYFLCHTSLSGRPTSVESAFKKAEPATFDYCGAKEVRKEFFRRFSDSGLLYFADVDNTVTEKGVLSEEKKRFFNNWEFSRYVVLSTGKIYKSIEKTIRELGLSGNPCCCLNGAVLYDGRGGVEFVGGLKERVIPAAKYLKSNGISYVYYYPDALRADAPLKPKDLENLERYDEMFLDRGDRTDFQRVVKLLAFVDEGDEESEAVVNRAANSIGLDALRTAPHSYEIVPPESDKGVGLRRTAQRLGRYFRLSLAVGDSMNDLPMLDNCGLPYIVSDAVGQLKAYGFDVAGENRKTDLPELFSRVSEGIG